MVRLSKLADYGLVLMACLARSRGNAPQRTARDLAAQSKLPLPTVSRLLKQLSQSGLLVSQRGNQGGYTLAKDPGEISILQVLAAVEGPVALTECSTGISGLCDLEDCCSIKTNQRLINEVVRGALEKITVLDLIQPLKLTTIKDGRGHLIPAIGMTPGRIQ
jgi:FeS assembly SUF system regulator